MEEVEGRPELPCADAQTRSPQPLLLPLSGPVRRMRIITLWQPYATLYAMRIKRHETRGWRPMSWDHGEVVGIHAAAKFPPLKLMSEELHELCIDTFGCGYNYGLPMGAVVCTTRFDDFRPTEHWKPETAEDRVAGDWTPGRYAWHGADTAEIKRPIPAKGGQGWWFASGELLSAIQEQSPVAAPLSVAAQVSQQPREEP